MSFHTEKMIFIFRSKKENVFQHKIDLLIFRIKKEKVFLPEQDGWIYNKNVENMRK